VAVSSNNACTVAGASLTSDVADAADWCCRGCAPGLAESRAHRRRHQVTSVVLVPGDHNSEHGLRERSLHVAGCNILIDGGIAVVGASAAEEAWRQAAMHAIGARPWALGGSALLAWCAAVLPLYWRSCTTRVTTLCCTAPLNSENLPTYSAGHQASIAGLAGGDTGLAAGLAGGDAGR